MDHTPVVRTRMAVGVTVLVLLAYVAECAIYYGRYLNRSLDFVPPSRPFAIEDVLGFGFWLTWLFFVVAFIGAASYWWRVRATTPRYLLFAITAFVLVTLVDVMLYMTLQRQILSM
jgi:hypothetical protein